MAKEYELYVLRLQNGRYYVGQTGRIKRRIDQHIAGNGAVWTKLYPLIERIETHTIIAADIQEIERREDDLTVDIMIRYGWKNVRGGHFCVVDEIETEKALRAHGYFDRIIQASHRPLNERAARMSTWMAAIEDLLETAECYYDLGFPMGRRDDVIDAFMALGRFREWHGDFMPAREVAFWDRKGLLPVLMSFLRHRPIGCRLQDPFAVLATALQRGRGGTHPWNRLLLLTWKAHNAPATTAQLKKVDRWMLDMVQQPLSAFDTRYDAFVSIAFPNARHLLRERDLCRFLENASAE